MIDIKTLRIGCHVLYNGERREVGGMLGSLVGLIINRESKEKNKRVEIIEVPNELLDPIPLTEELLKELGFEEDTSEEIDRRYYSKVYNLWLEPCEDMLVQMLLNAIDGKTWQCITGGMAFVKYLHELETFVFMTTKKELI